MKPYCTLKPTYEVEDKIDLPRIKRSVEILEGLLETWPNEIEVRVIFPSRNGVSSCPERIKVIPVSVSFERIFFNTRTCHYSETSIAVENDSVTLNSGDTSYIIFYNPQNPPNSQPSQPTPPQ